MGRYSGFVSATFVDEDGSEAGDGSEGADAGAGVSGGLGKETWGPIKKRWSCAEGNSMVSCSQTWGGRDDSALAPRMNTRTCGLPIAASAVSGAPGSTCSVDLRAEAER